MTTKFGKFKKLRRVATAILIVYLVVIGVMAFFEENLIYFPTRYPNGASWDAAEAECEDVFFEASDRVKLHGWFFEHPKPRNVVIYFHGNADYVGNLGAVGRFWRNQLSASVLVFDYRGYGRSEGKPNEKGLMLDADAAQNWLSDRAGVEANEMIFVGRSLGGGVAVGLAAKRSAKALVLQNTFSSLTDVAASHYPFVPVRWIMRNRFDSTEAIKQYSGPVFQSHGTADRVVPFQLAERLHAKISGRKSLFVIDGGGHNDMEPPNYYDKLDEFFKSSGIEID